MGLIFETLAIDCADPQRLAGFWTEALDYRQLSSDHPDEIGIVPDGEHEGGRGQEILFLRVPEGKTIKNRLHLDLRPADQAAEVERLLKLGATRVDIGQGQQTWVVLADPEGNEFCVLRVLTPGERAARAKKRAQAQTQTTE